MLRKRCVLLCLAALSLAAASACLRPPADPRTLGSAASRLKPVSGPPAGPVVRKTVFVPAYSSIYWGVDVDRNMVELGVTVTIRNVSSRFPVRLESVRYFDSHGKQVREYLDSPGELGPMASVEFVILQRDTAGGPGANFLVTWAGAPEMDEPFIEALMVGQNGNAGISFTSPGRVVKDEGPR